MKYLAAIAMTAMGMLGLHFGVDYSGWVLLAGCLLALG